MRKHRDIALYFVSLCATLMLFLFCVIFLVISDRGVGAPLFSVSKADVLHTRMETLGSAVELDYTPLVEPERIRRDYAPLLTPRPILTAEYAVDYASYWSASWARRLEEYLFQKEAYGMDAVQVSAPEKAP